MPKDPITLRQLLQYLNSENEEIQICDGFEWELYSVVRSESYLLEPYLNWYVIDLGAIDKDIIRITIRKEKEKEKEK